MPQIHPEPLEPSKQVVKQSSFIDSAPSALTGTEADSSPLGVLVFVLHSGRDLMSADSNGLSDPYCIVKVPCNPLWRSRVVKKTLNPVWEHRHEFEGMLSDIVSEPVHIRVYDRDVTSLNDPIGRCTVSLAGIGALGEEKLYQDVPLEGVPHGSISFSASFELKPVFGLFPGTPVHASAAQALRRVAPPDATCQERLRDSVLRFLCHRAFTAIAVCWACTLVGTILFIVYIHIGLLPYVLNKENKELMTIGWPDAELKKWANIGIQICTGLFSYLNLLTVPWRSSIALHVAGCYGRSAEAGHDFYGRPTEALWFHIPKKDRGRIAFFLILSTLLHYGCQVCHIVWPDYDSSNEGAGAAPTNITFLGSILCGVIAGVMQGKVEKKLMAADPERYPPGVGKVLKDTLAAWKRGEGIGSGPIGFIRTLLFVKKDETTKWHIAKETSRHHLPVSSRLELSKADPHTNSAVGDVEAQEKVAGEGDGDDLSKGAAPVAAATEPPANGAEPAAQ